MTRITPRALIAAWKLLKSRTIDVFKPGVAASLPMLPEWPALGLPMDGLEREPSITLLDALRAVELSHRQEASGNRSVVELVATLPDPDRNVLATRDVVLTMLEGARSSILVAGFEFSEPSIRRLLMRRGIDQIAVTVVGDRQRGSARELLKDWPPHARPLRALENIEPATPWQAALFHAKAIVVDGDTALIGSANFTTGGLKNNVELGVRLTGSIASQIEELTAKLARLGWLVPA